MERQETLFTYPEVQIELNQRQRLALRDICREIDQRPRGFSACVWQSLCFGGVYELEDWALAAITDAADMNVTALLMEAE